MHLAVAMQFKHERSRKGREGNENCKPPRELTKRCKEKDLFKNILSSFRCDLCDLRVRLLLHRYGLDWPPGLLCWLIIVMVRVALALSHMECAGVIRHRETVETVEKPQGHLHPTEVGC
jgi:hypothetical protein